MIREHTRIKTNTFNIIGYPGETVEDIRRTIRLSRRLNVDTAVFFTYTPHPGTEAAEKLKKELGIESIDWDSFKYNRISYLPPGLTPRQFRMLHTWAHLSFYLRPSGIKGLLRMVDTRGKKIQFLRGSLFFSAGV